MVNRRLRERIYTKLAKTDSMLPRQKMWRIYYFVNLQKIPGMYSGMYF